MSRGALDHLGRRLLSCWPEVRALRAGIIPPPRMVIVYPTHACNHACLGCDYATANAASPAPAMSALQLFELLARFAELGAQGWEACGGGEPTLWPELPAAIEAGAERGLAFGLLTNGTRLGDPELVRALLKHGSYCRVSLESATAETFNRYKRPRYPAAGFEAVVGNVRKLVKTRDAAAAPLLVSLKFAIGKHNAGDVCAAFSLAKCLGVDSLQFKALRNVPEELDAEEARKVQEAIDLGRGGFPDLHVLGGVAKSRIDCRCWLSPLAPTVDPAGDLYLCCYYRHRPERHRLGNVFGEGLGNLWGSPRHRELMRAVRPEECNAYDCRFHGYHLAAAEMAGLQLEFI